MEVDADHRCHAVIGLAIRDIREGSGRAHRSSGHFLAHSARLVIAALAHDLVRRVTRIGLGTRGPVGAATIARSIFTLPGRSPFMSASTWLRAVSLRIRAARDFATRSAWHRSRQSHPANGS